VGDEENGPAAPTTCGCVAGGGGLDASCLAVPLPLLPLDDNPDRGMVPQAAAQHDEAVQQARDNTRCAIWPCRRSTGGE